MMRASYDKYLQHPWMSVDEQDIRRLGKRELGRHAFEERMPQKTADALNQRDNRLDAVIPKLAGLLEQDHNIEIAYLCSTSVAQVSKLKHEGAHFCGYRNIQMLLSSIPKSSSTYATSSEQWLGVPEVQELVEQAWDKGFNSHGRVVTGGIRGTRKHIGTSEAEALLLSLEVPCTGRAFAGQDAWLQLLDSVEQHFSHTSELEAPSVHGPAASTRTVVQTDASPMFLQRPGHSLTIIGLEKRKNGSRRVLCFDPAWQPPSMMQQPRLPATLSSLSRRCILQMYRKKERYLKRYHAFETLVIDMERLNG